VFQLVCERTGAHIPEGDIFYDGIAIPGRIENHKIYDHVADYFRSSAVSVVGKLSATVNETGVPAS
jgi:hypothetical protein